MSSETNTLEHVVNCMTIAVMRDDFKLLKQLCETAHTQFDLSVNNRHVSNLKTQPLESAIEYDQKEMFEYLLPYSTFAPDSFNTTTALDVCLRCQNFDFATQVIPYYSSGDLQKYLIRAAEENMWPIVDLISKHVNADASEYQDVLLWASAMGNQEAIETYYTFERAQKAWERVTLLWEQDNSEDDDLDQFDPEDIHMLVEYHEAHVLRNTLQDSVGQTRAQKVEQRKSKI